MTNPLLSNRVRLPGVGFYFRWDEDLIIRANPQAKWLRQIGTESNAMDGLRHLCTAHLDQNKTLSEQIVALSTAP
jgi:hypothetical protein